MPHLSKLAKAYKDKVTFLALSNEEVETVGTFLEKKSGIEDKTWSQAMSFTVATDPDKSVMNEIFLAAGQNGIPATFIISGGKLQWVGSPMSMDKPLEQILDGSWDLEKASKEFASDLSVNKLMKELKGLAAKAKVSGNWNDILAFLDDGIEKYPTNVDLGLQKWSILLMSAHQDEEAYTYGKKFLDQVWDNAEILNQIAWTVVDDANVQTRDLKFAMKAAKQADKLTKSENGAILDTLARVYYETGNLDEAIKIQDKAVKLAEGPLADQIKEVLEKYKAEKKKSKKGSGY